MTQKLFLAGLLSILVQAVIFTLSPSVVLGLAPSNAPQTTRCVNPTGAGGCFTSIQNAITAANPGDTILVDTGVYTEHISIGKNISIYGRGVLSTTINGNSSAPQATVYVFSGDVTASTVISGVHITGGGTGSTSADGSGILIASASPTIINTWVDGNTGRDGGGVSVIGGTPTFTNVAVWNNRARRGGGFYLNLGGPITISGNPFDLGSGTIMFNQADEGGGGIYTMGVTATLSGLHIYGNTAGSTTYPAYGGGVLVVADPFRKESPVTLLLNDIRLNSAGQCGGGICSQGISHLTLFGNWIEANSAACGGGAYLNLSGGLVQTNWFLRNTVQTVGGGMVSEGGLNGLKFAGNWFEGNQADRAAGAAFGNNGAMVIDANVFVTNTATYVGALSLQQPTVVTITNNLIARNVVTGTGSFVGGVLVADSPARFVNNTIADNAGDGMYLDRANGIVIVNNIISGQSRGSIEKSLYDDTTGYTIDYNDRYSSSSPNEMPMGAHDVSIDPLYKAAGADLAQYYHIQATSPISRSGSLTWAPPNDIDGESRLLCGISIGADQIPCPLWYLDLPFIRR